MGNAKAKAHFVFFVFFAYFVFLRPLRKTNACEPGLAANRIPYFVAIPQNSVVNRGQLLSSVCDVDHTASFIDVLGGSSFDLVTLMDVCCSDPVVGL